MWKPRRRKPSREPRQARSAEPAHYCFITRPGERAPTLKQLRAVGRRAQREREAG
jgi:hypothetical protein